MDENDSMAASNTSRGCINNGGNSQQNDAQMEEGAGGVSINIEDKLALLQEIYQRKQAELLLQFHQQNQQGQPLAVNEYLQLLQNVASAASALQGSSTGTGSTTSIPAAAATSSLLQNANLNQPISHPLLSQLRQTSSDQSTDTENMDMSGPPLSAGLATPSTPAAGNSGSGLALVSSGGLRNRRTMSGSGQTISQHTRDRLKTMIATKKQKQKLYSSCSAGSTSNIAWLPPSNSELSFFGTSGGGNIPAVPSTPLSTTSNHFEPYPQLSHRNILQTQASGTQSAVTRKGTVGGASTEHSDVQASEFQLRKVNSEPNLKMRIRARLLNKGNSPQQTTQAVAKQQSAGLKRTGSEICDNIAAASDDAFASQTTLLLCALAQQQQKNSLTAAALASATNSVRMQVAQQQIGGNLIMPSPSLPNLLMMGKMASASSGTESNDISAMDVASGTFCNLGSQQSLNINDASEAANLLMQMQLASYLSMPSLLNTSQQLTALSMFHQNQEQQAVPDSDSTSSLGSMSSITSATNAVLTEKSIVSSNSRNNRVRFDTTRSPLPITGGYPSLLKQQLRDLVLRRKSLVREEPEEEQSMEVFSMSKRQHQQQTVASKSPIVGGTANPFVFTQLKTGLAYDQVMAKHQCMCADIRNHVEHGGRVQSIWGRLQELGIVDACERVASRKAPPELLQLVHSAPYVAFFAVSPTRWLLRMESPQPMNLLPCGGIGVDLDTYFNFYDENVQHAICVAAGLLVELTCQVAEGKLRNGFACIRPPGHHAEREQAMGFCFCNNVAIAVRFLQQRFSSSCGTRVAIIDWDVHHGNGTQLCFEADPSVLYISLHRHDNGNFFPGTGAVTDVGVDAGRGYSVNIPFSGEMMGDAEYMAAWRVIVIPLLDVFRPEFVLVSCGFDAASYNLSPRLFSYFTRTLMSYANGRVVLSLEGGYDLSVISDCAEECVRALCSAGTQVEPSVLPSSEELDKIPNQSAQETIQKVIAVHKRHWPCLTGIQGINSSELHWQTISQRFSSLTVHSS